MQIILTQNVPKLGKKGDVKQVKNGYFLNFLHPKGFAKAATPKLLVWAGNIKANAIKEREQIVAEAEQIKKQIEGLNVKIEAKTTGKDTLYGKITEKDIVAALTEQAKIHLDKKQVDLAEPIKTAGKHTVRINLTEEVSLDLEIEIVPVEK